MAHITLRGVTDEVGDLVQEFIGKLEAAGHGATIDAGPQAPAENPFDRWDNVDDIPQRFLDDAGMSREEIRRGREMRPAVDVHAMGSVAAGAAPTPPPTP